MPASRERLEFRERLWPPLHWWLLSCLGVLVVFVILWSVLPTLPSASAGALLAIGAAAALLTYAAEVQVDDEGLRAGPAALPWSAIGDVTPLDATAAADLRGPGMDPRGYLFLRGYVRTAVRVEVRDADDPTPYWYVSTRRHTELAGLLVAHGRTPHG